MRRAGRRVYRAFAASAIPTVDEIHAFTVACWARFGQVERLTTLLEPSDPQPRLSALRGDVPYPYEASNARRSEWEARVARADLARRRHASREFRLALLERQIREDELDRWPDWRRSKVDAEVQFTRSARASFLERGGIYNLNERLEPGVRLRDLVELHWFERLSPSSTTSPPKE